MPIKAGSLLFCDGILLHSVPKNSLATCRRASHFNYPPVCDLKPAGAERLGQFGGEVKLHPIMRWRYKNLERPQPHMLTGAA